MSDCASVHQGWVSPSQLSGLGKVHWASVGYFHFLKHARGCFSFHPESSFVVPMELWSHFPVISSLETIVLYSVTKKALDVNLQWGLSALQCTS